MPILALSLPPINMTFDNIDTENNQLIPENSWRQWASEMHQWVAQRGTWIPAVSGVSAGSVLTSGTWTKIGTMIHISVRISGNGGVFSLSSATVTNLPFAARNMTALSSRYQEVFSLLGYDDSGTMRHCGIFPWITADLVKVYLTNAAGVNRYSFSGWYETD